jgi:hypothetical protein
MKKRAGRKFSKSAHIMRSHACVRAYLLEERLRASHQGVQSSGGASASIERQKRDNADVHRLQGQGGGESKVRRGSRRNEIQPQGGGCGGGGGGGEREREREER